MTGVSASLPPLTGSEAQIAWAEKIRAHFISLYISQLEQWDCAFVQAKASGEIPEEEIQGVEERRSILISAFEDMIQGEDSSVFWIDNRESRLGSIMKEHKRLKDIAAICESKAAQAETTMIPDQPEYPGAVEIRVAPGRVRSYYQKNEAYSSIMHQLHLRWNREARAYERKCNEYTGDSFERGAELANTLLREGFAVICQNKEVRRKAVQAEFHPECRRWIKLAGKKFAIWWGRGEPDFYEPAKSLPGSRWDRDIRSVTVPLCYWREVKDFAFVNQFCMSAEAIQAAEAYEMSEILVAPQPPRKPEEIDKLKDILDTGADVLDDLRDD